MVMVVIELLIFLPEFLFSAVTESLQELHPIPSAADPIV